ncbi:acyltransferase [uncultured Pseudoteredinibacter sp.]|uniref:acyltransferase family protein n=1 Tax=uncultured Pseudoteredinibacter sp. TaxID=1641701 RepID=UPI0026244F15|nr:acyltransferase [uncultured Pseudoteredinibacter sp.]
MKNKYHSLHGLRALAAISVLLFHWGSAIGFFSQAQKLTTVSFAGVSFSVLAPLDFGWLGVPVFFILSAVLLGEAWKDKELNISSYFDYLRRRFLRIFPAFWLQLLLLVALASVAGIAFELEGTWHFIRHALLLINLPPWMDMPINPVWWTLPVEFTFYLLLPFMAVVFRSRSLIYLLLFGLLLTICWRLAVFSYYDLENYASKIYVLDALPGVMFTFCLGLAVALSGKSKAITFLSGGLAFNFAIVGFVGLLVLLKLNLASYWSGGLLLLVWPAMVAVCLTVIVVRLKFYEVRLLSSKVLQYLGDISFGIYLWHYPVLQFLSLHIENTDQGFGSMLISLLATLAITVVLAHLSYRLLELPCMRLFR